MKALVLEGKDRPLMFQDVKVPYLKPDLVNVKVHAAALNHRDVWITQGLYAGIRYPVILGSDGAGVVEGVAQNISAEWLGKEVILNPSMNWGANEAFQGKDFKILGLPDDGTFAEIVSVEAGYLHPKPAHLTMAQAAALPLAGLTAFRALFSRARAQPGERVLVTGIGGGVALFALQFAKAAGCEVWVTSSSEDKLRAATGLGAKGGINYRDKDWRRVLQEKAGLFDVIIDGAGGPGFAELTNIAANGGRIAIYGGTAGNLDGITAQRIFWKQLSILGTTMGSPADFHNMLRFVDAHKIAPIIDEVFPFSEAPAAFTRMAEGKQFGKIVLEMV